MLSWPCRDVSGMRTTGLALDRADTETTVGSSKCWVKEWRRGAQFGPGSPRCDLDSDGTEQDSIGSNRDGMDSVWKW